MAIFAETLGTSMEELANCFEKAQKEAEDFQKQYEAKKREMANRSRTFNRTESRGHSCGHSCGTSYGTSHSTGTNCSHRQNTNADKTVVKDNAYFAEMLKKNRQRHEMEQHKKVVDDFVNEVIRRLEDNVARGKSYVEVGYRSADSVIIKDVVERLRAMNFEVKPQEKGVFVKICL